jgi:hypothetical protein
MRQTRHHGKVIALDPAVMVPGAGRPEPPADLSERERVVWVQTAEAMPSGWFGRESWPLLKAYCRHAAASEIVARKLAAALAGPATKDRLAAAEKLSKLHAREGAALCTVAYALRLSPKSRLSKSAATTARGAAAAVRPWEDD